MRIIGVDPGSRYTGIGIIDRKGNQLKMVHSQTITTMKEKLLEDKLVIIFEEIKSIINSYQPEVAAIEKIFHSVNPRSSLILGHARGVAMLALKSSDLEINEYAPTEVKSAVVGAGRASKDQVGAMVQILLNTDRRIILKEDESDALAVAICYANTINYSKYK